MEVQIASGCWVGILEMGITGRLGDGKRSDFGLAGITLGRT